MLLCPWNNLVELKLYLLLKILCIISPLTLLPAKHSISFLISLFYIEKIYCFYPSYMLTTVLPIFEIIPITSRHFVLWNIVQLMSQKSIIWLYWSYIFFWRKSCQCFIMLHMPLLVHALFSCYFNSANYMHVFFSFVMQEELLVSLIKLTCLQLYYLYC